MRCDWPVIDTPRLRLRPFARRDMDAVFRIFSDLQVNTYLPWPAVKSYAQAKAFYDTHYAAYETQKRQGCRYAVCLRQDDVPIGYVHLSEPPGCDLGYGLLPRFWHRGIMTEACTAVLAQAQQEGYTYVTATHDVNNPASGAVMRRLGMQYCSAYWEKWQPKNIWVLFRMYQYNFVPGDCSVYRAYWEHAGARVVERQAEQLSCAQGKGEFI